jgi:hypothetical protein
MDVSMVEDRVHQMLREDTQAAEEISSAIKRSDSRCGLHRTVRYSAVPYVTDPARMLCCAVLCCAGDLQKY